MLGNSLTAPPLGYAKLSAGTENHNGLTALIDCQLAAVAARLLRRESFSR
jgi:hypothetical protein